MKRITSKLIRFTTLPNGVIAQYDKKRNLLLVNRAEFDKLPDTHKGMVLKTTDTYMLTREVPADQEFVFKQEEEYQQG